MTLPYTKDRGTLLARLFYLPKGHHATRLRGALAVGSISTRALETEKSVNDLNFLVPCRDHWLKAIGSVYRSQTFVHSKTVLPLYFTVVAACLSNWLSLVSLAESTIYCFLGQTFKRSAVAFATLAVSWLWLIATASGYCRFYRPSSSSVNIRVHCRFWYHRSWRFHYPSLSHAIVTGTSAAVTICCICLSLQQSAAATLPITSTRSIYSE